MKIAIVGLSGMLGSDVCSALDLKGHEVQGYTSKQLNILNKLNISTTLNGFNPDIVINCAAMTDVDQCEIDIDKAFLVNDFGVKNLVEYVADKKIRLIHVSTDYVFDGTQSEYIETDLTNPINIYGRSKLHGERHLIFCDHVNLRVQWLYGANKNNYVLWLINAVKKNEQLSVLSVQRGVPTSTNLIAEKMNDILSLPSGTYHFAPHGSCSKYDVARFIQNYFKSGIITETKQMPLMWKAKRPRCTVLNNEKISKYIDLPSWEDDLTGFLKGGMWKERRQGV